MVFLICPQRLIDFVKVRLGMSGLIDRHSLGVERRKYPDLTVAVINKPELRPYFPVILISILKILTLGRAYRCIYIQHPRIRGDILQDGRASVWLITAYDIAARAVMSWLMSDFIVFIQI